jgi:hypothetical protein
MVSRRLAALHCEAKTEKAGDGGRATQGRVTDFELDAGLRERAEELSLCKYSRADYNRKR